jgi:hypothetical protein
MDHSRTYCAFHVCKRCGKRLATRIGGVIAHVRTLRLPFYPDMAVKVWSNFSNELAQQVIAGALDIAVVTGVPDTSKRIHKELFMLDRPRFNGQAAPAI